jgi:putative Holliday junction resolvase
MHYLGIDFGLRRVGLAVSEGELTSPWQIIEVKGFSDAVEKVAKVITEGEFDKIVVGLPEGRMGKNVLGFVNALKKKGFEVETFEETLSSKKALEVMIEQGVKQKKRRHEDAYSAAGILQNYLDYLK